MVADMVLVHNLEDRYTGPRAAAEQVFGPHLPSVYLRIHLPRTVEEDLAPHYYGMHITFLQTVEPKNYNKRPVSL